MVVLAIPAAVAVLATRFEWSERVFSLTRRWEGAQLDEWPLVVFALAICLTWLSWRRSRQVVMQLQARRVADAGLAEALANNQRLARQNLRIQESKRKYLARELHDELGQYSNAIKLDAMAMVQDPRLCETQTGAAARRIVQAADHVHAVASDMIRRPRPVGLDELGPVAAVESCVDHWRQTQHRTRMMTDGIPDKIAVLLVDDHAVVREGYRCLLETRSNIIVVGEAASGTVALEQFSAVSPDVVVMDIALPASAASRPFGACWPRAPRCAS